MEDCDSETLLDWIKASKKLKLNDSQIVASLENMLANIQAETRLKMQETIIQAINLIFFFCQDSLILRIHLRVDNR